MMGRVYVLGRTPSIIGSLRFGYAGTQQQIVTDGNISFPALASTTPAAGGTGCNVNDRFYDAYNNTYTATAVTAGAVTTIAMNAVGTFNGVVPANPIALTAAPGFAGTGVTVNLSWTSGATNLLLANNTTAGTMTLTTPGMTTVTNGLTVGGQLVSTGLGMSFGNVVAPGGVTDLSRHIALYSTIFGLSITHHD